MINNQFQKMKKITIGIFFLSCTTCVYAAVNPIDKSLCDLKVLSLLIPKQTKNVVSTGSLESTESLKDSQEKMSRALVVLNKNNFDKKTVNELLRNGKIIDENIELIVKNQKKLDDLYVFQMEIRDRIPKIQDKYNFIVNRMAVGKYSAIEVLVPKNQILLAERILRSSDNMTKRDDALLDNIVEFLANLETFNVYLQAQLEGSFELGIKRAKDKEVRETLELIQKDMDVFFNIGAKNIMKNRQSFIETFIAVTNNSTKLDEVFNALEKLGSNKN